MARLMGKRWRVVLGLFVISVALFWGLLVHPFLVIAAGYGASLGAMQHFATGDSLETIQRERIPARAGFLSLRIDEEQRAVEARALYVTRRAVYRDGLGATRDPAVELQLPEFLAEPLAALDPDRHWPIGSSSLLATTAKDVDAALLAAAINRPFEEEGGTHAIVVIHRGELIFERYAPGYTLDTPLMGWSLTKSVTATLAGRLVKEGRLDVDAPAPVAEWEGDSRRSITLDDLLRMRSGLAFHQDHSTPFCDSLQMLFVSKDCAGYARDMPLAGEPGETWMYSDGTANIVAGIVSAAFSDDLIERLQAPRKLLFGPLGMTTAFIGVDGAGNFVGSSFMYASARDWARFGLLYAQDGVWDGERLLPEGWASYVANPPQDSAERGYGAHFWRYDNGPIRGVYFARGYQGQYVFVDPLRDVVLVRLGVELVEFDGRAFAEATLAAFPSR